MKPSTALVLAGLGALGYYLWKSEQDRPRNSTSPSAILDWRDEDLPPELAALPPSERKAAGDAYFGRNADRLDTVASELRAEGYSDAASRLEIRAVLVRAAEPEPRELGRSARA